MDAGRDDEECERQHGQADEQREPVGPARATHRTSAIAASRSVVPIATAGIAPKAAAPDPQSRRGARVVADPEAGVREAVAGVARDERPRIEGVDGQVRIAAGGDRDLLEETRPRYGG